MIRVLIVDDHAAFRQSLAFTLQRETDITVAGQAGSLIEAKTMLSGVDVALIDIDLPDGNGLSLLKQLRADSPQCQALVVTGSTLPADMAQAVLSGAGGVLHKSAAVEEITSAVRSLAAGADVLTRQEVLEVIRHFSEGAERFREEESLLEQLTLRELDVLRTLASGSSDKEIGEKLHITTETVRTHMVRILAKLDVHSRMQALILAVRHGYAKIT